VREVIRRRLPLIYFYGGEPGRYLPQWPVFIVDDKPQELSFTVAVDDLLDRDSASEDA